MWARMKDGVHTGKLMNEILHLVEPKESMNMANGGGVYANLFCAHPPYQIEETSVILPVWQKPCFKAMTE